MKVLALELSSAAGSIAVAESANEIREMKFANDRKSSAPFFRELKGLSEELLGVTTIVVGTGPGSYAGTRIAIATGTGLALAAGAELLGYPSICAIDTDAPEYVVVADVRRGSFMLARVSGRELMGEPELHDFAGLADAMARLAVPIYTADEAIPMERVQRRFPSAARLATFALEGTVGFSRPPLEPMYLRAPHITTPTRAAVKSK